MSAKVEKRRGISLEQALPDDWKFHLGQGALGYGVDLATTTKKLSNPSALAVVEKVGLDFAVRLAVRWKTDKPAVTRAMIERALDLPRDRRARRLCIDATSERFFATDLQAALAGKVIVELVIASETAKYLGREMSFKLYLGNLLQNACNDAQILLPNAAWLQADLRQPEGGTFIAEVDETGNHADCFGAISLAIHGLTVGGGPVRAYPTHVSSHAQPKPIRTGIRGPIGTFIGAPSR